MRGRTGDRGARDRVSGLFGVLWAASSGLLVMPACAWAAALPSSSSPGSAALSSTASAGSAAVERIPLPAIRTLAGLTIQENVDEFRSKLSSQNTELRGLVARPLQGPLLRERLQEIILQTARTSGRFGLTYLFPQGGRDAGTLTPQERLEMAEEFQVDGFLEASLLFFPDHVSLSFRIRDVSRAQVLASQNLVMGALPTEAEIADGFAVLWARLAQAVGHLSRISWQSGDLVTVDLGEPRTHPGQKLMAGLVVAERVHPRTGEILSYRRESLVELRVLESNEGSSLAKVTALKAAHVNADGQSRLKGLLVWDASTEASERPAEPGALAPAMGLADAGFDYSSEPAVRVAAAAPLNSEGGAGGGRAGDGSVVPPAGESSANPANPSTPVTDGEDRVAPIGTAEGVERKDPSAAAAPDEGMWSSPAGGLGDRPWSDAISDPASWRPLPFTLGAGQSYGILDTAPCANTPCNRYTGFPRSLLNLVQGTARYQVTRSASLSFEGRFSNYPSGDVEGYELGGRALSVHTLSASGREQFVLYAGPEIRLGKVETVLVERGLMALTLRGGGGYSMATGFGRWTGRADVSLLDILAGKFVASAGVTGTSLPHVPAPLGVFFQISKSPHDWTQIELGAQWTFSGY